MTKLTNWSLLLSAQLSVRSDTTISVTSEAGVSRNLMVFSSSNPVRVKALHNPYSISFSESRVNRFLAKLKTLIDLIEQDHYLDQERFQLLLEIHWINARATRGNLLLPTWDLYMFKALQSKTLATDKETFNALLAVTKELRN